MNGQDFIGETLDDKYLIESQLGRGGMGTVYLSTHLGTGRPVAVKIIAPDFMERAEFVERFRREARAAGRLRHPNVVDVTDFGISETKRGSVAYLVMEYLDGCTLGEILAEEGKLPLDWTLDILEQTCNAVGEAHRQGIIHRDLKPDNIWLEPDGRGGYTVKVLDFGIAKLEEEIEQNAVSATHGATSETVSSPARKETPTAVDNSRQTFSSDTHAPVNEGGTLIFGETTTPPAVISEGETAIEGGTLILPEHMPNNEDGANDSTDFGTTQAENGATKILKDISANRATSTPANVADTERQLSERQTASLTRVGAILGTPLYMSPEQCRGRGLDARADVYSLGVIAYQMLSGATPFSGAYTEVLRAHQEETPPPLKVKGVPKRISSVIASALSKEPWFRPPTADAFAGELRSAAGNWRRLIKSAMTLFAEYLPQFFGVTFLLYSPVIFLQIIQSALGILLASDTLDEKSYSWWATTFSTGLLILLTFLATLICGSLLHGVISWLIVQKMAFPMRPMRVRPALQAVRARSKPLIKTLVLSSIIGMIGTLFCFVPGIFASTAWMLTAPAIMFEKIQGRAALRRSYELVKRNFMRSVAIGLISWLTVGAVVAVSSAIARGIFADVAVLQTDSNIAVLQKKSQTKTGNSQTENKAQARDSNSGEEENVEVNIKIGGEDVVENKVGENQSETKLTPEQEKLEKEKKKERRFWRVLRDVVYTMIQIPLSFLAGAFFSVVISLLYIQSRLAGGESLEDLIQHFEETEQNESRWKQRINQKLAHGTRTSKNTSTPSGS